MDTERIERAGFNAWQKAEGASFDLMLAYKHGQRDSLERARGRLRDAISVIDAALEDGPGLEAIREYVRSIEEPAE